MNDDLIARLIAGPGSRELDAEIWANRARYFSYSSPATSKRPAPHLTTSIDAAVAFAVAVVGAEKAMEILKDATARVDFFSDYMRGTQDALDATPATSWREP